MLLQNCRTIRLAILIIPVFLAACANRTELQFFSDPPGAMIKDIGTGNVFGMAPTNRQFDLESVGRVDEEGCYVLSGVEALWESGALKQMSELQLCGIHRRGYTVTLVRPPEYPDLDKDIEVANNLQASADLADKRFDKYLEDTRLQEGKRAMNAMGELDQQNQAAEQMRDKNR